MKPLHQQVRIVDFGGTPCALYAVELYDGEVWEASHSAPLPRARAEQRARWLSDVLEHARDAALEEAAQNVIDERHDETRQYYAESIRGLKGVRDA